MNEDYDKRSHKKGQQQCYCKLGNLASPVLQTPQVDYAMSADRSCRSSSDSCYRSYCNVEVMIDQIIVGMRTALWEVLNRSTDINSNYVNLVPRHFCADTIMIYCYVQHNVSTTFPGNDVNHFGYICKSRLCQAEANDEQQGQNGDCTKSSKHNCPPQVF